MASPSESHAAASAGPALPFAVEELERVAAPSRDAFARGWLRRRRPVVLLGLTDDWLPLREWTPARLAARHGTARVLAARLAAQGRLMDDAAGAVLFEHIPLAEFVESLGGAGPAASYVMAPTWNFPASFQREYRVPRYCTDAQHMRAKVWLGKAGTVTPFHRDVPHNLHVHLYGRKRWLLVPPGGAYMYPRGLFSSMPNFSRVDPEQPDWARHPRFRDATVFAATLGPGETLFIPQGWWHHTRSLHDAVAMNFWWGGRAVALLAHASTTFKRLRGIRQNEWS
jgi:hypothetical protein